MDHIPQNQVLMSCTGCGLTMLTFTHLLQISCLCLPPCQDTLHHIALPSSHCTDRSCHCHSCTLESQRYVAILMSLQPNLSVLQHESDEQYCSFLSNGPIKSNLHPFDKKLQYCSSDSCCINKRSYEPLQNH